MGAEFYYPERILTLLIVLIIVFFIARSHKLRRLFFKTLETNKSLDRSYNFNAPKNRFIKETLFVLALLLVSLALMRPRWGEKERKRKIQSVDVCIAVDLSQSMLAEDMSPNRLRFAKREMTLLLEKLTEYRVSLVGFAGGAFVAAPLTTDLDAVADMLSPLNTDYVSMPSTFLEGALITCAETLGYEDVTEREDDDKTSSGIVLLVTDGDDNLDTDSAIVKGFKRKKITINTYLVGKDQPMQIPLRDEMGNISGFVKDPATGAVANTKIETDKVKKLTDETSGKLYMAEQIGDFATLFSSDLKMFESRAREEGVEIEKAEQFQIPLLIAIFLLFIDIFLTETGGLWPKVRKKYFHFVWLLLFSTSSLQAASISESLRNNFGVFLFNQGRFADAHKWFQKNVESSPENKQFLFNWASARLNKVEAELQQLSKEGKMSPQQIAQSPAALDAGEIAKIIESLSRKEKDPLWNKMWSYQLGNALEMSGQSGPAVEAYYQALREPAEPNLDVQAKHNLGRLLKENSQSGASGQGDGSGGDGGGAGSGKDPNPKEGQAQKPQEYKGQNFNSDQVKQILQNVGSEERNVMKKKSKEESQTRAKQWGEGSQGDRPW